MRFDRDICSDLGLARRKEWLVTNGIGGFASATITGMNTRRYHGLLTAATRPPVGRMLLLSKLEERLWVGDASFDLSCNDYPGAVNPQGHRYLMEFRLEPLPVFLYSAGGAIVEKTVFMVQGENSTAVRYRLLQSPGPAVHLELRSLIAFRDYHSLTRANAALDGEIQRSDGSLAITPYAGLPTLFLNHNGGQVLAGGAWYYNLEYGEERERGLDCQEDLYNPFGLRFDLGRSQAALVASTSRCDASRMEELIVAEISRRERLLEGWEGSDRLVCDLVCAADQFLVRRGENHTVMAGYHWFTDWGRDTMISLPGLTVIPGRFAQARQILLAFAQHCDQGMLPNRFPDAGEAPEYNTVDATLWFFQAVYSYVTRTSDYAFVRDRLYRTLLDILQWHFRGTRYGIGVDGDGLLSSGVPGVQLTWMDAKVGDWVVTPRHGKPVEIQALWYNALRVMEHLANKLGDAENAQRQSWQARKASRSFNEKFWNSEKQCLYDCISADTRDPAIRPNQIFAASLPFSMLPQDRMRQVVDTATRHLLTPVGLRSLSPEDPDYRGRYHGGPAERDAAYHQGTVWPWLLGPYLTARVRAGGEACGPREEASALLAGMREHLQDAGLGTVSEIFDGDPPHGPKGCIAQAWSVAEILRCAVEDLALAASFGRRPTAATQTGG